MVDSDTDFDSDRTYCEFAESLLLDSQLSGKLYETDNINQPSDSKVNTVYLSNKEYDSNENQFKNIPLGSQKILEELFLDDNEYYEKRNRAQECVNVNFGTKKVQNYKMDDNHNSCKYEMPQSSMQIEKLLLDDGIYYESRNKTQNCTNKNIRSNATHNKLNTYPSSINENIGIHKNEFSQSDPRIFKKFDDNDNGKQHQKYINETNNKIHDTSDRCVNTLYENADSRKNEHQSNIRLIENLFLNDGAHYEKRKKIQKQTTTNDSKNQEHSILHLSNINQNTVSSNGLPESSMQILEKIFLDDSEYYEKRERTQQQTSVSSNKKIISEMCANNTNGNADTQQHGMPQSCTNILEELFLDDSEYYKKINTTQQYTNINIGNSKKYNISNICAMKTDAKTDLQENGPPQSSIRILEELFLNDDVHYEKINKVQHHIKSNKQSNIPIVRAMETDVKTNLQQNDIPQSSVQILEQLFLDDREYYKDSKTTGQHLSINLNSDENCNISSIGGTKNYTKTDLHRTEQSGSFYFPLDSKYSEEMNEVQQRGNINYKNIRQANTTNICASKPNEKVSLCNNNSITDISSQCNTYRMNEKPEQNTDLNQYLKFINNNRQTIVTEIGKIELNKYTKNDDLDKIRSNLCSEQAFDINHSALDSANTNRKSSVDTLKSNKMKITNFKSRRNSKRIKQNIVNKNTALLNNDDTNTNSLNTDIVENIKLRLRTQTVNAVKSSTGRCISLPRVETKLTDITSQNTLFRVNKIKNTLCNSAKIVTYDRVPLKNNRNDKVSTNNLISTDLDEDLKFGYQNGGKLNAKQCKKRYELVCEPETKLTAEFKMNQIKSILRKTSDRTKCDNKLSSNGIEKDSRLKSKSSCLTETISDTMLTNDILKAANEKRNNKNIKTKTNKLIKDVADGELYNKLPILSVVAKRDINTIPKSIGEIRKNNSEKFISNKKSDDNATNNVSTAKNRNTQTMNRTKSNDFINKCHFFLQHFSFTEKSGFGKSERIRKKMMTNSAFLEKLINSAGKRLYDWITESTTLSTDEHAALLKLLQPLEILIHDTIFTEEQHRCNKDKDSVANVKNSWIQIIQLTYLFKYFAEDSNVKFALFLKMFVAETKVYFVGRENHSFSKELQRSPSSLLCRHITAILNNANITHQKLIERLKYLPPKKLTKKNLSSLTNLIETIQSEFNQYQFLDHRIFESFSNVSKSRKTVVNKLPDRNHKPSQTNNYNSKNLRGCNNGLKNKNTKIVHTDQIHKKPNSIIEASLKQTEDLSPMINDAMTGNIIALADERRSEDCHNVTINEYQQQQLFTSVNSATARANEDNHQTKRINTIPEKDILEKSNENKLNNPQQYCTDNIEFENTIINNDDDKNINCNNEQQDTINSKTSLTKMKEQKERIVDVFYDNETFQNSTVNTENKSIITSSSHKEECRNHKNDKLGRNPEQDVPFAFRANGKNRMDYVDNSASQTAKEKTDKQILNYKQNSFSNKPEENQFSTYLGSITSEQINGDAPCSDKNCLENKNNTNDNKLNDIKKDGVEEYLNGNYIKPDSDRGNQIAIKCTNNDADNNNEFNAIDNKNISNNSQNSKQKLLYNAVTSTSTKWREHNNHFELGKVNERNENSKKNDNKFLTGIIVPPLKDVITTSNKEPVIQRKRSDSKKQSSQTIKKSTLLKNKKRETMRLPISLIKDVNVTQQKIKTVPIQKDKTEIRRLFEKIVDNTEQRENKNLKLNNFNFAKSQNINEAKHTDDNGRYSISSKKYVNTNGTNIQNSYYFDTGRHRTQINECIQMQQPTETNESVQTDEIIRIDKSAQRNNFIRAKQSTPMNIPTQMNETAQLKQSTLMNDTKINESAKINPSFPVLTDEIIRIDKSAQRNNFIRAKQSTPMNIPTQMNETAQLKQSTLMNDTKINESVKINPPFPVRTDEIIRIDKSAQRNNFIRAKPSTPMNIPTQMNETAQLKQSTLMNDTKINESAKINPPFLFRSTNKPYNQTDNSTTVHDLIKSFENKILEKHHLFHNSNAECISNNNRILSPSSSSQQDNVVNNQNRPFVFQTNKPCNQIDNLTNPHNLIKPFENKVPTKHRPNEFHNSTEECARNDNRNFIQNKSIYKECNRFTNNSDQPAFTCSIETDQNEKVESGGYTTSPDSLSQLGEDETRKKISKILREITHFKIRNRKKTKQFFDERFFINFK